MEWSGVDRTNHCKSHHCWVSVLSISMSTKPLHPLCEVLTVQQSQPKVTKGRALLEAGNRTLKLVLGPGLSHLGTSCKRLDFQAVFSWPKDHIGLQFVYGEGCEMKRSPFPACAQLLTLQHIHVFTNYLPSSPLQKTSRSRRASMREKGQVNALKGTSLCSQRTTFGNCRKIIFL